MQLLIQLVGNFTVFRKNSEEKIPETPGCSNHVKVPLWSTLLLYIAEFPLYLVTTWDEFKSKILILRINCNANDALKWKKNYHLKAEGVTVHHALYLANMGVYSEC